MDEKYFDKKILIIYFNDIDISPSCFVLGILIAVMRIGNIGDGS
jgi:hypothetical protein